MYVNDVLDSVRDLSHVYVYSLFGFFLMYGTSPPPVLSSGMIRGPFAAG